MERTCKKCGETKPIEMFMSKKDCKNGREYLCKKCGALYNKEYRKLNSRILKQKAKAYRELHKEYLSKYAVKYFQRYKISHKEIIKARRIKYRESNKNILNLKSKQHRVDNRVYYREKARDAVVELKDFHVVGYIHKVMKLSRLIIKQHPELIENYRQQIKLRRLIKIQKNENTKTS